MRQQVKHFKSSRMPYTKAEQLDLLDFLVKRRLFCGLRGRATWEFMERHRVCGGTRTWQSLKENFRKQILPRLGSFGLKPRHASMIRRGWAGEQVNEDLGVDSETTEEMEKDEEEEDRYGWGRELPLLS